MSDDNAHARPTDMHKTCCTPSAPSRRGVLAAGAGFAGIATAQLFAAQAVAAGTSATLDQHIAIREIADMRIMVRRFSRVSRARGGVFWRAAYAGAQRCLHCGIEGIGTPCCLHLLAGSRPRQPISEGLAASAGTILFVRRPAVDPRAECRPERRQLGIGPTGRRPDYLPHRTVALR
jgi:hypothetical protein